MNYPVFRNLRCLAWAWRQQRHRVARECHAESLMAWRWGCLGMAGAQMTCNNRRVSGRVIPRSAFSPQRRCSSTKNHLATSTNVLGSV